jgi:hypothetical protein
MQITFKKIIAITISILILILAIETLSNFIFYVQNNKAYYNHKPNQQDVVKDSATSVAEAVFHPYYSYINRVGRSGSYPIGGENVEWVTNNVGFQVLKKLYINEPSRYNYPRRKASDEIVIGIFGGSVASGFALTMQGSNEFNKVLSKIQKYKNRKITILNFAMPGFKQPQQLLALAYYLSLGQEFDLVINIDGFNEVVTGYRNYNSGVETTFPADTLWGEWGRIIEKNPNNISVENVLDHKKMYFKALKIQYDEKSLTCKLAACYLFNKSISHMLSGEIKNLNIQIVEKNKRTIFPVAKFNNAKTEYENYEYIISNWKKSSLEMEILLRTLGAEYVHVIQPNQWDISMGKYSPIDNKHIYEWLIKPVNFGYPMLRDGGKNLKLSGITVLDKTDLFKGLRYRDIYVDDCCHYTDKGAKILGESIINDVYNYK